MLKISKDIITYQKQLKGDTVEDELEIFHFNERYDKLELLDLKCPICGKKHMAELSYVNVSCKSCGNRFMTDFSQGIYTKKARELDSWKANKNGFKIRATEPFEEDLIYFKDNHIKMKCWDITDDGETVEEHKRCKECGVCLNCFTCKSCGKTFEKIDNRRRVKCPHCKSHNFTKTYFKKVSAERTCPECSSHKIMMTRTESKTKCHLCGSKNLSEPIRERVFWLTIMRKKGYWKDE